MDTPKKRNRKRVEGSYRFLEKMFDVNHETIRKVHIKKLGIEDPKYKTWEKEAIRLQGSIQAAQKRGEWTVEDKQLAGAIAAWLLEQATN